MAEYRTNSDTNNLGHQTQAGASHSLSGILERITYHNEENGYTVGRLAVEGSRDLITVIGNFTNPIVGELLVCEGCWVAHREFGRQFAMERYSTARPATTFAIEKYLGSGLIKGVGPVMAKRMVDLFQTETLDVIEKEPGKLLRVEGIGARRVAMIQRAWHEQREIRNVMLFLQGKGVSATYAVKIYKKYADQSIAVVEENPYRLAQDIWGIGFKTADKIAQQLGVAPDSPRRLEAGLLYTLSEATDFGHMYLPESKLYASAATILDVDAVLLSPVLEQMVTTDQVKCEAIPSDVGLKPVRAVFHPALYFTEVGVARDIAARLSRPVEQTVSIARLTEWFKGLPEAIYGSLSEEQISAVAMALTNRLFILTGGPGTGKTLTTNAIVRAFEARKRRILLVSPTGRAAKRLSEVTGREAQTIHRLLKFDPATRQFSYNENNRLECDLLIADEVSMLDAVLANNLLKAIPEATQIVLVGDSDQLPSVGAGNVLGDLITSGTVPSLRLTRVFRQAEASLIVKNAYRIRNGEMPDLVPPSRRAGNNCLFIEVSDPPPDADPGVEVLTSSEAGAIQVVKMVKRSLPALGFHGDDIQVLSPMHRGAIGVGRLNELLQDAVNPIKAGTERLELLRGSRRFRTGDRVIQLVNNYEKSVYNGDVGSISKIDMVNQTLNVRFSDVDVEYDFADYDELQLAYAMSVHKAQGSEYRAVVLVVHSSQYMMLQRNLVYTGLTRARDLCIIVGDRRGIARAVRNDKTMRRYTRLAERLEASCQISVDG